MPKLPIQTDHSNVDEDQAKESLIAAGANPLLISKNLDKGVRKCVQLTQ